MYNKKSGAFKISYLDMCDMVSTNTTIKFKMDKTILFYYS